MRCEVCGVRCQAGYTFRTLVSEYWSLIFFYTFMPVSNHLLNQSTKNEKVFIIKYFYDHIFDFSRLWETAGKYKLQGQSRTIVA